MASQQIITNLKAVQLLNRKKMKKNKQWPRHIGFLVIGFLLTTFAKAQGRDTTRLLLSIDDVTAWVLQYHPIAKQAALQVNQANAQLTITRGAFDPVLSYTSAEKTFDGTQYYAYQQPTLTIPTWFGMEVQTGAEKLRGNRANPTETLGQSSYLGIQIPIGRDLLTDKRRTDLQKAKIAREASSIEKRKMLNDLLLETHSAYWQWWKEVRVLGIVNDALQTAQQRLQLVKESVRLGDRPAIDTLEAFTQVQQFELQSNQVKLAMLQSQWELSQFLWQEAQQPYLLPENCRPTPGQYEKMLLTLRLANVDTFLQATNSNHPEILLYNFKKNSLTLEKRYRAQQLLPKASLTYNFLEKGIGWTTPSSTLFQNNFQYGLSFAIPLRLSAERGAYRSAQYALQSVSLEQDLKKWQLQNKVRAYYYEVENVFNQVHLQQKALSNFQALLKAEELRFKIGESSLFLINARELRTWEASQKLEETKAKYLIALQKLHWAAGLLQQ
jgi:outer membrane protein TolC